MIFSLISMVPTIGLIVYANTRTVDPNINIINEIKSNIDYEIFKNKRTIDQIVHINEFKLDTLFPTINSSINIESIYFVKEEGYSYGIKRINETHFESSASTILKPDGSGKRYKTLYDNQLNQIGPFVVLNETLKQFKKQTVGKYYIDVTTNSKPVENSISIYATINSVINIMFIVIDYVLFYCLLSICCWKHRKKNKVQDIVFDNPIKH